MIAIKGDYDNDDNDKGGNHPVTNDVRNVMIRLIPWHIMINTVTL